MKYEYSTPSSDVPKVREEESPITPYVDTSPRIEFSDGRVSTADREARLESLFAARRRVLAGTYNTYSETWVPTDEALERIEAQILANSPVDPTELQ